MEQGKTHSERPSGLVSFFRYNVSAIIATGSDFLVLILLTEIANLWYVTSTAIGAATGACIAFTLGRNWAFKSTEEKKRIQALRYVIVAIGSLLLNTFGVFALTDWLDIQYIISKTITAVVVAVSYNYLLAKHFIFK